MDKIEAGRTLYRGKVLREEGSAAALLARFKAMKAFRESRPAAARKALQLLGLAGAGIVISLVVMAVSRPAGIVLLLVSLAVAALAIFLRAQALAPMDSRAEHFLEPLFLALGEDLGSQPVRLVASLAPLQTKEFLQGKEERSVEGYHKWTDCTYARVLVSCACRLRDDSRLWLAVREKMVESTRKRWKGSRKKKLKTKVRTRSSASVVLRIAPPAGWKGTDAGIAFPADCPVKWVQRGKTRVAEVRFREKMPNGAFGVSPDRTLRLLQMVYQNFSGEGAALRGGMQ